MAEAFPQFEERKGNVIRRRGGEGHEKRQRDFIGEYTREFRDPLPLKGEIVEGKSFEEFLLGKPDLEKINAAALEEGIIHEKKRADGSTFFVLNDERAGVIDRECLKKYFDLVQEHQKSKESIGEVNFPQDLQRAVLSKINERSKSENEVTYNTSVDTALDYSDGVGADGFFVINGTIITFDVSERLDKKIRGRHVSADVFIGGGDVSFVHALYPGVEGLEKELAEGAYQQQISRIADRFVEVYENRMKKAA